jgi:4-hydroxybenzoate polyprenyltransferase
MALAKYAHFVKFEHTVFSIPVVLAGTLLHLRTWPEARLLGLVLVASAAGRAVGMGLNRIIDAAIDACNPRTRVRELPSGRMQRSEAWVVVVLAVLVYAAAAAAIHPICLYAAPLPVTLFAVYPYLKRFTWLAHLGLGLAWSMAPLGGWLAAAQTLQGFGEVFWLWAFALFWVAGFDIIYATLDEAFDREARLFSMPAVFGKRRALQAAAGLHAVAWGALALLWYTQLRTPAALLCLGLIAAVLVWQHGVADRRPGFAFFQLNGALGFLVLAFVWSGIGWNS